MDESAIIADSLPETGSRGRPSSAALERERNLDEYSQPHLKIVRRHVGAGLLVNVGDTSSGFPNAAESAGFDVTMLGQLLPSGLSPEVRFREGSISNEEPLAQLEGVFDVVTAWAVLQHLPQLRLSTKVLSRMCRPGGLLFLSTPEVGTFLTDHSVGRSPWTSSLEPQCLPSPRAIVRLFEPLGCTLLEWGRVKVDDPSWAAKHGVGLAEAISGLAVKTAFPGVWQDLRDKRFQRYKGMAYIVLQRT